MDYQEFYSTDSLNYDKGAPACSEAYPDAFFPVDTEDENGKIISRTYPMEAEAKSTCISCVYRIDCLLVAMKSNDMGIWGGTTERERKSIKRMGIDPRTYQVRNHKGVTKSRKSRTL